MWRVPRGILNLGILAHVDAGKTTLTERLLYSAGVIDQPGSVDEGTTQTDSLALERQRGITIKSAVVSFSVGGTTVNLIDTPGHPDFVAEVERALSVLDGAVLVVSAVEGVQPQTRILWRALQRLRVPTLFFVNKIDRRGAGYERLIGDIAERLTPAIIPMGSVSGLGTREAAVIPEDAADPAARSRLAELLAAHDDEVLSACLDDTAAMPYDWLHERLAAQVRDTLVYPVYFGSAITGAGVEVLLHELAGLLPAAAQDAGGPVAGRVFKVERGPAGDKIAYVRVFSGTIATRDRVRFGHDRDGKVTAISVFADGTAARRDEVTAGQIARLGGLAEIQVGDRIGTAADDADQHYFAPPTLETAIVARDPRDKPRLYAAITEIAEQDPLINVRQDDIRQEIYVSLYGEVQKQVIEATLGAEYGIEIGFRETTPICVERPAGTGAAEEILHAPGNPFLATLGFRIDPAPAGTGLAFRLDVGHQSVPLYIYKNMESFAAAMQQYVTQTLRQGLYGWQVTDCTVSLVRSRYSVADGPTSVRGPTSGPQDFRKLTPLVVMAALRRAGTVVCEPVHRFRLDTPADTLPVLLPVLARLHAVPVVTATGDFWCTLEGDIPVTRVHELRQQIPPLTRGEGVMESSFDHYEPVRGPRPTRPRTDDNPLDRAEYLLRVTRGGGP
jgi:ribosomal protection tetracycline resistance protein